MAEQSKQPVDALARIEAVWGKGSPEYAAVAELIRLTERVLYVQSLTGNAKAQAWDKLDRDIRDALARVGGAP